MQISYIQSRTDVAFSVGWSGNYICYTFEVACRLYYKYTSPNNQSCIPDSKSKSLRCPLWSSIALASSRSDHSLTLSLSLPGCLLRLLVLLHFHLRKESEILKKKKVRKFSPPLASSPPPSCEDGSKPPSCSESRLLSPED